MQVSATNNLNFDDLHLQNNQQQVVNIAESKEKTVKPKNHICYSCERSFVSIKNLIRHNKTEKHEKNLQGKKHSCLYCKTGFYTQIKLQEHYLTNHESLKPYSCDFCDKSYTFETSLLQHYRKVHHQEASRKTRASRQIKYYKCDLCDSHLTLNSRDLTTHYKQQHLGKRPFTCDFCDKGFLYLKTKQKHHRDMHQGESLLKTSNQKTVSNNENPNTYQYNNQHKVFELIDDIMPDIAQGSSADDIMSDIKQELSEDDIIILGTEQGSSANDNLLDIEKKFNEIIEQNLNEIIEQYFNEIIEQDLYGII